MRESALIAYAKKKIRERGGWVVKYHGSPYSEVGVPDLIGCINGRLVAIEMKMSGQWPTATQYRQLDAIARAGGYAFWADSRERFDEELERFLRVKTN